MSAPGIRLQTSCDRLRELHVSEVFTVITETREAADQFAREGEAACIMCLSNGRSRDSANPMLLRQAVNCLIRYQL
ncbi:hypothetical protein EWH23_16620 [Meiothermus sp. PNK-Is4]|nr:hypothetical protein EWH23_16620 [Meiothermus sp. PNK-Is4]